MLLAVCCGAGGALWGHALGRISGYARRRLALAGALSFAPTSVGTVYALAYLESHIVASGSQIPLPLLFAMLFVPALFIVAAIGGAACGWSVGGWRLAGQLALSAGTSAALAFLLADVVQHVSGRQVGGPNAEATLTMLSVAMVGNLAAAMAGSAVIGTLLIRHRSTP